MGTVLAGCENRRSIKLRPPMANALHRIFSFIRGRLHRAQRQAQPPRTGVQTTGCNLLEATLSITRKGARLGVGCSALFGCISRLTKITVQDFGRTSDCSTSLISGSGIEFVVLALVADHKIEEST